MTKGAKKTKMTLDKLAQTTQREFLAMDEKIEDIRQNMATKDDLKLFATKEDLKLFATKEDLKLFATKDDLKLFATKDDLKTVEVKILQAVDKVITRFDESEKEEAAHTNLHKHITDDLHRHNQRIKKLEAKI